MTTPIEIDRAAIREAGAGDLAAAREIARLCLDLEGEDAERLPDYLWDEEEGTRRVRLIAHHGSRAIGLAIGSIQPGEAFLDLIAVVAEERGRGVGARLLGAWEDASRAAGATVLKVGENLRAYVWPGVDIRYTPAICLFESAGYRRTRIVYNMDLPVDAQIAPAPRQLERLGAAGITARRAETGDLDSLTQHVRTHWSAVWERETLLSLQKQPPAIFVALRGERVIGFAAHGVYRPALYGPIATDPAEQGHGVGNCLSRMCLADMAAGGVRTAQIGWVAEDAIRFYSRTVGARLGRCFWMMAKQANRDADHADAADADRAAE